MFKEQRVAPREALALPVKMGDGSPAVTRDISSSGMYLEIAGLHALDGPLLFEMHLTGAKMKFTAEGEVVRVERGAGFTGIAVKLHAPRLESTD